MFKFNISWTTDDGSLIKHKNRFRPGVPPRTPLGDTTLPTQWRSDAVRGQVHQWGRGPKTHCRCIAQKAYGFETLDYLNSRVSCEKWVFKLWLWHAHKSSVADTKLILKKALRVLTPL